MSIATTSCTSTDGTVTVIAPVLVVTRGVVPAVSSWTLRARTPAGNWIRTEGMEAQAERRVRLGQSCRALRDGGGIPRGQDQA